MINQSPSTLSWRKKLSWVLVLFVILIAAAVRIRLRETPLERDEGEYAYAGQLLLQRILPYEVAYNMKFPGTYAAYALIMAVFGSTSSGIHLGLALVNAACTLLLFLIARRLLDDAGAVTAAVVFALMSLSPSVLGLAAHATHFVVLFALAAILLLLHISHPANPILNDQPASPAPLDQSLRRYRFQLLIAGLLFGCSILMKQHGVLFAAFGGLYLIWCRVARGRKRRRTSRRNQGVRSDPSPNSVPLQAIRDLSILALGGAIPYIITCATLALGGAFKEFWFWTFTYARKYVSSVPMSEGPANLLETMGGIFADNPYFWICLALGAVVMWWDEQLNDDTRFFLTGFTFCSMAAVSAGFYFREHYFIMLLPALALINGVAVSRSLRLLRRDTTIELFLTIPVLLLVLIGFAMMFVTFGSLWFTMSPTQASTKIYGSSIFADAKNAAEIIMSHTPASAKIAVLGSEPEIYFYSRRLSATGFIYAYPLMEKHDFAPKMQEQLIHEIETAKPEYIVFVNDDLSWLKRPSSDMGIFHWWDTYWNANYNVEQTIHITQNAPADSDSNFTSTPSSLKSDNYLLIFKRK